MPAPNSSGGLLKQEIQKSFKLNGYQLRMNGSKYLEELLADLEDPAEWKLWIDKILEVLQRKELESSIIDKGVLEAVVQDCSSEEAGDDTAKVFNVINVFEVPRLSYSIDRKKFLPDAHFSLPPPSLYADAESKARFYRDRYAAVQQRTARHKLFTPAVAVGGVDTSPTTKKYQLKTVDYLLGTSGKLSNIIVLGALSQIKVNKYSLEDPTGLVDLDLSHAKFHQGLYTENCYVLVEGWYEDMVFHVVAMGHPPIEMAEASKAVFGTINYFGGPLETSPKASSHLLQIERSDDSAMIVFVSDLWLDKPTVLLKFNQLLAGFASVPPTAFVLMGNFISSGGTGGISKQSANLKELLSHLGDMISEYEDLKAKSKFIFVPGPQDPGFPHIFPRPVLPEYVTEDLRKKVPSAIFSTNPCRIQYCTQEIVVFREDIVTKMCRNCVYFPESGDIPSHFGRTILAQGHLGPLPLHIVPTYWDFDRSLWIYPIPDLIVIGDKFDPFTTNQNGCNIVNPGSFAKNDYSFKTYVLKSRQVEDSQIPDE